MSAAGPCPPKDGCGEPMDKEVWMLLTFVWHYHTHLRDKKKNKPISWANQRHPVSSTQFYLLVLDIWVRSVCQHFRLCVMLPATVLYFSTNPRIVAVSWLWHYFSRPLCLLARPPRLVHRPPNSRLLRPLSSRVFVSASSDGGGNHDGGGAGGGGAQQGARWLWKLQFPHIFFQTWFGFNTGQCEKECLKVQYTALQTFSMADSLTVGLTLHWDLSVCCWEMKVLPSMCCIRDLTLFVASFSPQRSYATSKLLDIRFHHFGKF